MKNLWILTEERPKVEVLKMILSYFAKDYKCGFFGDRIRIIPLLNENKCFNFVYEVIGFKCAKVDNIYIKTVSGESSFVDFLVFYQEQVPTESDTPIYAIEETKTDDKESRNTGVYQRCSKFVYIQKYFPKTKKIMLYALKVEQEETPTQTYVFGTRLLMTLGVEILGKDLDGKIFKPFETIDEIINYKRLMKKPPRSNVPILIYKENGAITITGRLYKNGSLSHDPNIGALSLIAAAVRLLGWKGEIIIKQHGIAQQHLKYDNKFVLIANMLNLQIDTLKLPEADFPQKYWHYESKGEKLGTIFIHIIVENFTSGYSIFENHAGCEKGYFNTSNGEHIPLAKYTDKRQYKLGDKSKIVYIPDLVLLDIVEKEVITIEGKKYINKEKGKKELANYDAFDKYYLQKYYSEFKIVRSLVLYGSNCDKIIDIEVGFLLNANGKMCLGINAPTLFRQAINNLLDYWN